MRRLAAMLLLAVAGTAGAVSQWIEVATSAETQRQAGAARWTVWTETYSRERCAPPGSPITEGTEHDNFNCLSQTVFLRNDTATPLQCNLAIDVTAPNYEGHTEELDEDVVYPGERARVSSLGPASSMIKGHTTSCVVVATEATPAPVLAAGCQAEVKPRDLFFFYPRDAIVARQEGRVQVEYTTRPDWVFASDVKVVRSSGIQSLDRAALRYAQQLRVSSSCPGQRFRYEVEFELTPMMIELNRPQVLE